MSVKTVTVDDWTGVEIKEDAFRLHVAFDAAGGGGQQASGVADFASIANLAAYLGKVQQLMAGGAQPVDAISSAFGGGKGP